MGKQIPKAQNIGKFPKSPTSVGVKHKFWFSPTWQQWKTKKSALEMAWELGYEDFINKKLHCWWHGGEHGTHTHTRTKMVISRAPGRFPKWEFDTMLVNMSPRASYSQSAPKIIERESRVPKLIPSLLLLRLLLRILLRGWSPPGPFPRPLKTDYLNYFWVAFGVCGLWRHTN